ncbi:MAG: mechanosensitive ion channel [Desulfobulbus sp.]|nr:mechanosensitive ion channel [Desulfobulbus sp.]
MCTSLRFCRLLPVLVLILFLLPALSHGASPEPAKAAVEAVPEDTGPGVLDQLKEMPEERPAPIRTEQIDRAGEQLGLRVGIFGLELAPLLGNWINRELAWGITWLKLLFCLALFVLILTVERLVRWLIKRRLRLEAAHSETPGWYAILLRGLSRPLSLFLWVYGTYGALSPLFSHLNRPGPTEHLTYAIRWAADAGGTLAALWFLHRLLRLLDHQLNRWAQTQQRAVAMTVATLSRRFRAPLNLLVLVVFARLVSPLFGFGPTLQTLIGQLFGILLIVVVTWLTVQGLNVLENVMLSAYHLDVADNLRARKMHTQVRFLKRLVISLIFVLAGGSMLMVFDRVRQLGTSILASAGIIGLVVGLAAQRSITNMLVGLQIALTQPIRLDDVVIVKGEWGRIEEITTTYVVVKLWDLRRLIVPTTWFTENPFQNWTRVSSELLGTVFLHVDYTLPVDAVREELQRVVSESPWWNGKVAAVQVTDSTEHTMELRLLVSAKDASALFDLRCEVRERMIAFLQDRYPGSLPRVRADLQQS